jgi:hypothetical protein
MDVAVVVASGAGERNAGWRAAPAPVVLFVDRPAGAALVEAHRACWAGAAADLGAAVSPVAAAAGLAPEPLWAAGAVSVRRDLLEGLGGFDERPGPRLGRHGEVADLLLRLRRRRRRIEALSPVAGRWSAWWLGVTLHRVAARHTWLVRTSPPGLATGWLGLGLVCAAAGLRWRLPAAAAVWVLAVVASALLRRGALRAVPCDLGWLLEGARRGDVRAVWRRVPPAAADLPVRLDAAGRDWTALAAVLSLAVLALAALGR